LLKRGHKKGLTAQCVVLKQGNTFRFIYLEPSRRVYDEQLVPLGGIMETYRERILHKLNLALQNQETHYVFPGIEVKDISLSLAEIVYLVDLLQSINSK
jgi:hypothetical protein